MDGTLYEHDGRYTLRFERSFGHPPKEVWRALTDPADLSQWYPLRVTKLDLRLGGKVGFDDGGASHLEGIITKLEPPHVFGFRESDDLLHFELHPRDEGCLLLFTHTFDDRSMAVRTAAGWQQCLDALESVVAGEPVVWPSDPDELQQAYAVAFGLEQEA